MNIFFLVWSPKSVSFPSLFSNRILYFYSLPKYLTILTHLHLLEAASKNEEKVKFYWKF